MTKLHLHLKNFFNLIILEHPAIVVTGLIIFVLFLGYHAKNFKIDASAKTLILEKDEDLRYSRLIGSRYDKHDYLLMAYTPKKDDLFSAKTVKKLSQLQHELTQLDSVAAVVSILDVPLLQSPPVAIKDLAGNIDTLKSPEVVKKMARREFANSPLYKNLLVSSDLNTTALQIKFPIDEKYQKLRSRRNRLREKESTGRLSAMQSAELEKVAHKLENHLEKMNKRRNQSIIEIRAIMDRYRQDADLFLGGVSMIAYDLIRFVRNDLKIFGLGICFFLIITLAVIFKKIRWVFLPVICCAFSAVTMMGLLAMFGWKVTVVSSNFISLQIIFTMAVMMHLIVRYREYLTDHPQAEHRKIILDSVSFMFRPCWYAGLTSIAGFGSLLLCDILPVITFGWMMVAGIVVSLTTAFLLFPAGLVLMKKKTRG
jgi:predicted RND superfamily exporter protein